jgi:DNA-binding NtrC family response regulator
VVDRFVTTDLPLLDIIKSTAAPDSSVTTAALAMEESLAGRRLARDAIRLAQVVPVKDSDPELMILLLAAWAALNCRIGRPADAEALLHQARGMVADGTHPEVLARLTESESMLADSVGDRARQEKLLAAAVALLPSFSPRRKFYLWRHALVLALQGRGVEAEPWIKDLVWQCNSRFRAERVHLLQFVNAVETGQVREAALLLPQAEPAAGLLYDATRLSINGYARLLALMQGQSEPPDPASPRPGDEMVRVAAELVKGNTVEALRIARMEADRMGALFGGGFPGFNLIRAELAAGNGVAAGRLLSMRQARGNRHVLDNFLSARVERLAGNRRQAGRLFAAAIREVDRLRARGRLDFELRLACEISPADIVQMARSADEASAADEGERGGEPATATQAAAPVLVLGRSPQMVEVRRTIRRFADLDAPVLITGETGVGKDLVAKAIHHASQRRNAAFTAVNCGSIAETLLESELFGHEKGAFTGAEKTTEGLFAATGEGTILLDEIGDISPRLQGALLRVLETGEIRAVGSTQTRQIRCRILAATNAALGAISEAGRFRQDLLFRLQRLELNIPPLRDRRDDILLLARHYLDLGRPIGVHADLSAALRNRIRAYDWPGNVRELRNVIERMRMLHSDKISYDIGDLDLKFQTPLEEAEAAPPAAAHNEAPPVARRTSGETAPAAPGRSVAPKTTDDVAAWLREGASPLRRLERLRDLFRTHRRLTRAEIMALMGLSANTATKYLQLLCREGGIRRVEPSASTRSHYFEIDVRSQ